MGRKQRAMVAGNEFDPHWCVDWQLDEAFLYCAGKGTTICSLQDRLKEDEYVTTIFQWQNMCYIFMAFFFFWLAKHLYRLPYLYMLKGLEGRKSEFKTGNKLIYKSNAAVAVSFTGYIIGLAVIFVAAIEDLDQGEGITTMKYAVTNTTTSFPDWSIDQWNDQQGENVWQTVVWTAMGLVMLFISRVVNDVMTCDLNEAEEIANEQNIAAAIMEGASYICGGLVAAGAISGRPVSWGTDVSTTWIYFGIGQILYMMTVKKFQISCLRSWDVIEQIKDRNAAAGVAIACETISGAIIIFSSVYLSTSLAVFGFAVGVGLVSNTLARLMADKMMMPSSPIAHEISHDKNWGAALVCGSAQIANSIMIMSLPASSCDDLSASFSDSLTETETFSRIFEYYMLFLLLLIPLFLYSVRLLYPLGLTLSGGVPDLDFLQDDDDEQPKKKKHKLPEDTGLATKDGTVNGSVAESGAGSGSGVELDEVEPKWFEGQPGVKGDETTEEPTGVTENPNPNLTADDFTKSCNRGMNKYNQKLAVDGHKDEIDMDDLLTHKDNKSIAISFSGYMIGVALLFRGTVSSTIYDLPSDYPFEDQMKDLLPTLLLLVLGLLCMLLCHIINDKAILPGMKNIAAFDSKFLSPAVGIVEAGSFIATGQILGASSYGYIDVDDSDSWGEAIFFQFFWFIIGQTCIIIMSCLSDSIFGGTAKSDVKKGKVSSGIFLSMRLITAGCLVATPIGKSDSIVTFVVMLPCMFVLCQLGKYLFRLTLACGSLFEDDDSGSSLTIWQIVVEGLPFKSSANWGNALLEGVVFLATANIFGAFLRGCDCYNQYLLNLL